MRIGLIAIALVAVFGSSLLAQESLTLDIFNEGGVPYSFTSDGSYMVVRRSELPAIRDIDTRSDTFVDLYQVSDFSLVASYDVPDKDEVGGIEMLAISHDARLIAYVYLGGLYVLDTTTGEIAQHTFNYYMFEALEFNPVNNLLAYVIGRGITVYDAINTSVHYELFDDVYGGTISSLAWSPDGRYLAHGVYRGGENHDVVVWDITDLESSIDSEPSFALLGGEPVLVAWRDSDTLASFGSGGVSIFDIPTRSQIVFIPNPENLRWSRGAWSPDGIGLVASGGNGVVPIIQIWDVSGLPAYKSVFYREGIIGGNVHWTNSGLFYSSRGGIRRDNEFLAPQLTATALGTPIIPATLIPQIPVPTPTLSPTPVATQSRPITPTPSAQRTPTAIRTTRYIMPDSTYTLSSGSNNT